MRALVLGGDDRLSERLAAALGEGFGPEACRLSRRGEGEAASEVAALRPRWVVYLAVSRGRDGGPDLADADDVWSACAEAEVPQVVAVGSTEVFEPSHHHPGRATEERPTPRRPGRSLANRWIDFEERARARLGGSPPTALALLRAALLLAPGLPGPWCRLLGGRWAPTLPGRDPTLQFLAPEDLARAVRAALERRARGTFHVVPRANLPLRRALRLAGVRRLPVPALLRRPAPHLPYLRHPWTAASEKLRRELGVEPERSSAEAVTAYRAALAGEPLLGHVPGTARCSEETVAGASSGCPGEVAALPPSEPRRRAPLSDAPPAGSAVAGAAWDDFGFDPRYVEAFRRTLFRFLHDLYWRVEVRGLEHLPRRGRAVLVGVHRGFMPWDGVMALHQVAGATGRYVRFLIHPSLVKFPFLGDFMTKLGGILATQENAAWVLERDEMVGIFPDGIRGAFTPYREAYRLGRSFRDDFARLALRHRAPILPFCTVGSAETFPIVGRLDWGWWRRLSEWPYLPITASLPLLPNPAKWHTWYLPPVAVEGRFPPAAADDPEAVAAVEAEVRRRLEEALAAMLAARRRVFWGSIFAEAAP